MTRKLDIEQVRDELVDACAWGEEDRARSLVSRLGAQPRRALALLGAMLRDPDVRVRQAAAFGLGELGGTASARLLEEQLTLEEARGDYDGASVTEEITRALGRLKDAGARTTLVRRLERLASGKPEPGDVSTLAHSLWRKRHPTLLLAVRQSLERLDPRVSSTLHGLLVLLQMSPDELQLWARNPTVPLEQKTGVITLLEEDLPDALLPAIPAFISEASSLVETAVSQRGAASYFCERLLSFLLSHKERILSALPEESCSELRTMAQELLTSVAPNCSSRSVILLEFIGNPEDAELIEAHRPAEPILAKVFDDAVRALRARKSE